MRRIIGKAVCLVTRLDAALACGTDQLCAGLQSGIEGAIHAMNEIFGVNYAHPSGWGVLMIDASNAFNYLNRAAMLLHARVLWSRCARFLFNTYCGWSVLVLKGCSEFVYSKEGVTQGDPLSMFMYAVGILPLVLSLKNPSRWTQLWYADDASAAGTLDDLYEWFTLLRDRGLLMGIFLSQVSVFLLLMTAVRLKLRICSPPLVFMLLLVIGSLEGLLAVRMRCCHMYPIRFNIGLIM